MKLIDWKTQSSRLNKLRSIEALTRSAPVRQHGRADAAEHRRTGAYVAHLFGSVAAMTLLPLSAAV